MKIVVAPDSFKGSMLSADASRSIQKALLEIDSTIEVVNLPMADGGEGTVDAILAAVGGEKIIKTVEDPLGRPVEAAFGWIKSQKTAVVETAAASGLPLLHESERNPYLASTYGTGQLIKSALDQGAETIILGIGGSATVDGGTGCFQALGVKFMNAIGGEMKMCGGNLRGVERIDLSELDDRLKDVTFIVASDVTNPLLGEEGAVAVFGPQKGVKKAELPVFEEGMTHYAAVISKATGRSLINEPGSGAAGGFGFSLQSFLNVELKSGFTLISEIGKLELHIASADLVITGEGKMDTQSLYGKVPIGVARLARKYKVPVVAFSGQIAGDMKAYKKEGLSLVFPIVDEPMLLSEAMEIGEELLYKASKRLMEAIKIGGLTPQKDKSLNFVHVT
jgi:glycerate 2-kinase